jgi:tetratricopeptide (TPR) repeat protein
MQKKEEAVSLWFIDKDPTHDWQASSFRLDANFLKTDFSEAASTQLLGVALSAIGPVREQNARYLVGLLKPVSERLRHLLEPSAGFTASQNAELQQALGFTLSVIGRQDDDKNALADAAKAFRAALVVWTREQEPLRWAATQNNLGNMLGALGERESGVAWLQKAISAFHEVLEVWTRDREPLHWAATQNNLAHVLAVLGERQSGESGVARLREASRSAQRLKK